MRQTAVTHSFSAPGPEQALGLEDWRPPSTDSQNSPLRHSAPCLAAAEPECPSSLTNTTELMHSNCNLRGQETIRNRFLHVLASHLHVDYRHILLFYHSSQDSSQENRIWLCITILKNVQFEFIANTSTSQIINIITNVVSTILIHNL